MTPGPPSIYRLRRQVDTLGLCTLEAVARALGILDREVSVRAFQPQPRRVLG